VKVAEVDAVGAIGPDDDVLAELVLDNHVGRACAGALDLQVTQPVVTGDALVRAVAEDADQVLRVRAGRLLLVAQRLHVDQLGALRRERREAGRLGVHAGLNQDPGPAFGGRVDRVLDVPVAAAATLGVQPLVELAQVLRQRCEAFGGVRLAHDQVRAGGPVGRDRTGGVRELRWTFAMR
jgi:hypothetical protein